jgi:hypothetical protein
MNNRLLLLLICMALPGHLLADETADHTQEARGLVKEFFGALKGELQAAMKTGGPTNAISTCKLKAPEIANQLSQKSGWTLARTSLKLRNQDNAPDTWEMNVLRSFESRKQAGEDITKMELAGTVETDGKPVFRYMKAIPTAELCLKCHGTNIDPQVAKKLDDLYPEDQARDYSLGDIRGAFTFQKSL